MSIGRLRGARRWLGVAIGAWMLLGPGQEAAAEQPAGQPLTLLSAAARQPAQPPTSSRYLPRRMRKNTISVGAQGQYGFISGGSELDDHYDHGPGYAFRARFMVSSSSAICFSFENQQFDAIPTNAVPSIENPDSHLVITTVAAEGTFYIHRDRETHPYFLGGFGYASPDVRYQNAGTRRVNEGPFLVLGTGLEHFIKPRFSIDATLRGFAQIGNSELSLVTELALGINLYPGD